MLATQNPELILSTAVNALSTGCEWRSTLDELQAPIYTADTTGAVTYWNRACIEFAGREPELGRDRWCVTWKLYTTAGEPLAHDECPMAQAIQKKLPIRGVIAIAERPDGTRVAFRPYPTPLFDEHGQFVGAVNLLVDVTDEQTHSLHDQADRCRRLAEATYDRVTSKVLGDMAAGFDKAARDLAGKHDN